MLNRPLAIRFRAFLQLIFRIGVEGKSVFKNGAESVFAVYIAEYAQNTLKKSLVEYLVASCISKAIGCNK